ncbi:MAG TPA: zinc ribbon domain-containing protein [Chloroflexota bacterium]|nr:zinc ribbon domain-containing protein [Chloroflexota bacterium]
MPIYEYRCLECGKYTSVLVRSFSEPSDLTCARCSGTRFRKLVSRFALLKSEDARLEQLADPARFGDVDENDPRSVARWARKLGSEVGEDLGDDFKEAVEQMEAEGMTGADEASDDSAFSDSLSE